MGLQIAETMTEIFEGLPPGHSLFEQFSFIGAEELPEFEAILRRRGRGEGSLKREDRTRLLSLPLAYIEARHRLGLLDDATEEPVRARRAASCGRSSKRSDPRASSSTIPRGSARRRPCATTCCSAASAIRVANAQARVAEAISAVVRELGLLEDIERVGLDRQVGTAGGCCRRRSGRASISSAAS